MNTTDFLTISTAICPERDAMVFEGKRFTYSQISQRVNETRVRFGGCQGHRKETAGDAGLGGPPSS